jgi:hypothetical protein
VLVRYILDPQLSNLLQKERDVASLPLALRRFADCFGEPSATLAMRAATRDLLGEYFSDQSVSRTAISVDRLCRLAGAQVIVPAKLAPPRVVYALGAPRPHRSPTGAIVFSSGRPRITVPSTVDKTTARISVAHELGHLLIHRRKNLWDDATVRLPSTSEEEALAEYAARLLLMPVSRWSGHRDHCVNLAQFVLRASSAAGVTVHSAVARLGDPDVSDARVRGAILWKLNPLVSRSAPIAHRMTPQWHLCPGAFVPVGKCGSRLGSLAAELAAGTGPVTASQLEDVRIGSFVGTLQAHGHAWGSIDDGTRIVLTVFQLPSNETQAQAPTTECKDREVRCAGLSGAID